MQHEELYEHIDQVLMGFKVPDAGAVLDLGVDEQLAATDHLVSHLAEEPEYVSLSQVVFVDVFFAEVVVVEGIDFLFDEEHLDELGQLVLE